MSENESEFENISEILSLLEWNLNNEAEVVGCFDAFYNHLEENKKGFEKNLHLNNHHKDKERCEEVQFKKFICRVFQGATKYIKEVYQTKRRLVQNKRFIEDQSIRIDLKRKRINFENPEEVQDLENQQLFIKRQKTSFYTNIERFTAKYLPTQINKNIHQKIEIICDKNWFQNKIEFDQEAVREAKEAGYSTAETESDNEYEEAEPSNIN